MSKRKILSTKVKKLNLLEPRDIEYNEVTCINITTLPEEDGILEFEGSWKALIKAILWLLYQQNSKHFTGVLYEGKVMDADFQICREPVGNVRKGEIVRAERIPGTPFFIDYDYSSITMTKKIKGILGIMNFNPKDVSLTLKRKIVLLK